MTREGKWFIIYAAVEKPRPKILGTWLHELRGIDHFDYVAMFSFS
jgi:hypothetical protein